MFCLYDSLFAHIFWNDQALYYLSLFYVITSFFDKKTYVWTFYYISKQNLFYSWLSLSDFTKLQLMLYCFFCIWNMHCEHPALNQ